MEAHEKRGFTDGLMRIWKATGLEKKLAEEKIDIYFEALGFMSLPLWDWTVKEAISQLKYFPKPAELIALSQEKKPKHLKTPVQWADGFLAWCAREYSPNTAGLRETKITDPGDIITELRRTKRFNSETRDWQREAEEYIWSKVGQSPKADPFGRPVGLKARLAALTATIGRPMPREPGEEE